MNQAKSGRVMRVLSVFSIAFSVVIVITGCSTRDVRADQPDGNWRRVETAQTLSFADAGRVSGDAGCNRFSGSVELDDSGAMRVGPIAATKRGCADSARMREETDFLAMLDRVRGYRIERDGRLHLLDAAGHSLMAFVRDEAVGR